MAFRNIYTTLTPTTAQLLVTAQSGDLEVWINSDDVSADYLVGGDSSLGLSNGLRYNGYGGDGTFHTKVRPGDEIWVISSAAIRMNALVRSA